MGIRPRALVAMGLFLLMVLSPVSHAHEQKTLTVIMNENGVVSGNITDPSFLQGNAVWFQMHDDRENATMVVRLDVNLDGVFNASEDFDSGELVNACELDENGTLMDEDCAVSALYAFDLNATVDTYAIWVVHTYNGTETMWNHSIMVHKDVHEEEGPSPGDCFGIGCEDEETTSATESGTESWTEWWEDDVLWKDMDRMMTMLLVISLIGMVALTRSIVNEKKDEEPPKEYPNDD